MFDVVHYVIQKLGLICGCIQCQVLYYVSFSYIFRSPWHIMASLTCNIVQNHPLMMYSYLT